MLNQIRIGGQNIPVRLITMGKVHHTIGAAVLYVYKGSCEDTTCAHQKWISER